MAYRYYIDPSVNCVFIQHVDLVKQNEIREAVALILADANYRTGMNFLRDANQAPFSEKFEDRSIEDGNNRVRKIDDLQIGSCRVAWVVANGNDYGIIHRFSVSSRFEQAVERKPFRELEKAREWLGIPDEYQINYPE